VKQESQSSINDNPTTNQQAPPMFLPNNGLGIYDDLEGQLFGPLPPYLMQQNYDLNTSTGELGVEGVLGNIQQQGNFLYQPVGSGNDMDEIFAGADTDWNFNGDQRFR